MKVLIADKFEPAGVEGLKALGCEVVTAPDLKEESLREAIAEQKPGCLIVRSTKVEESHLGDSLRLVVRAGAGYNTIDVKAAKQRGIQVANCPGKNADAVAELTFGLILCLDRRIPDNVLELRSGRWNKKEFSKAKGLRGRSLGVIGLGSIGRAVVALGKAFGMRVSVFSRHSSSQEIERLGAQSATLEQIAAESYVVSVHVSLSDETKGMLDETFFDAMRPGTLFVNTSRAEVVNQTALLKAVESKGIRAGLDVFEGEPSSSEGVYDGALKSNPNVYCTHHIGASTDQAQDAVAEETVRIVKEFMETGCAPNCVNC
jgi:D-3-phosphoglycerate dehydrogenase